MRRIQKEWILKDLKKKMVFIVGPRQSGKTWLAKDIAKEFSNVIYLNYDQVLDRKIIKEQAWLPSTNLLILDELHKMENWKNFIKGIYDTKPDCMSILVTGSARLDIYDHFGDSLAGRYFRHRLLPLSLAELKQVNEPVDIEKIIERGGFPEPYLEESGLEAARWRDQYINSILSSDVFEFDKIANVKALRLIFELLRSRVGSTLSYQALSEDASLSPTTVKKYVQILESLYIIFRVTPFSKNIARSLLKEPKIYFFDIGLVKGDDGAKLENLVAVSLLKHVYAKVDYEAKDYSLSYLRTKDGLEVDFILSNGGEIEEMIEVKLSDGKSNKTLIYFHEKYGHRAIQLVKNLRHEHTHGEIRVLRADKFLSELYL